MRLWMLSGGTVAAATAMGLTLGSYAVSPQRSPLDQHVEEPISTDFAAAPVAMSDPGPQTISCTGCGPTLAERRYAADMAGYDSYAMIDGGSSDPMVQDYMAQDYGALPPESSLQEATLVKAPVPTIHQLPPNVVRFADGPSPAERPAMPASRPASQPAARSAMRVALGGQQNRADAPPRSTMTQPAMTAPASAY